MKISQLVVYLFLIASCVSPFDIHSIYSPSIVVEGLITDQPGPYLVQISKSIPLEDQFSISTDWVSNATVTINDDQGNSEVLTEKSSGQYYTNTIQGVVGRVYSIKINTNEGWVYQSAPDTLLPVGDFSLRQEFQLNEPPYTNRQVSSSNGFRVYLDSDVLPEQKSRVWWRWLGTFEYGTFPQLRKSTCCGPPPGTVVPAPLPCSGYGVGEPFRCYASLTCYTKLIGPLAPCQCCSCWATQYNQEPLISDPQFVTNGKINNQYMGFVEVNVRTFSNKYHLEVQQLSASASIHNFWRNVRAAQSNSSNLFQIPPPRSGGNVKAVSANAIPVVGYFAASALKSHVLTFTPEDVPYNILPMDTLYVDCREVYKNSSNKRPAFW